MNATASTLGPMTGDSRRGCGPRLPGRWNAPNAILTVLALMLFGPFGLLVLAWVISGRDVRDIPAAARALWARLFGGSGAALDGAGLGGFSRTGNVVFDDYQRTQHERIREIREEMGARARRFAEFRESARRRADEEEFERFMASAPEGSKEG